MGPHPEAIQIVADALIEASERTQLIVTTHSDALIDALSERPEDVLITERDADNSTQFRRLDQQQLSLWLEQYSLGRIWRRRHALVNELRIYFEGDDRLRPGVRLFFSELAEAARRKGWRFAPPVATYSRPVQAFRIALQTHSDAWNVVA